MAQIEMKRKQKLNTNSINGKKKGDIKRNSLNAIDRTGYFIWRLALEWGSIVNEIRTIIYPMTI